MNKIVKIIALICVAALGITIGTASILAPAEVQSIYVQPQTATITFTERGSYAYEDRYLIYPVVSGEVQEVLVKEGDVVSEGQVLAVVDAADYLSQIAVLENNIAGYRGQIANLNLQEQQRKDQLSSSQENLKGQIATLEAEMRKNEADALSLDSQIGIQSEIIGHNRNNVSIARQELRDAREYDDDETIDQARQAYNTAQNILSQSELALEQLKSGNMPAEIYEENKGSLEAQLGALDTQFNTSYSGGMVQYYQAQINSALVSIEQMNNKAGQSEIVSPVAGVISKLPIKEQNFATGQSYVASVGIGGQVEVFVPVREMDNVHIGDTVELLIDKRLGKETVTGRVTEMDNEAQVQLSTLGIEERRVRVLIRPSSNDISIGYDMDVQFTVFRQENAIVVPKTAVFTQEGGDWVWVVQEGVLHQQQITKGIETMEGYIVDSGIKEDDLVVSDADISSLKEGKTVNPLTDSIN